ncbi:MAG: hybrid sensor histidine kinase/response regulator, partial [Candidatus Marinimicrobia bacterium]|nr:hybrid sensor histidine kinase/response regulator [Candidatus Neomarinimicrobiota bacterium]
MDQENHYHILVVDDDEVDRRAVSRGLANSGLQVEIAAAHDGSPAIHILTLRR